MAAATPQCTCPNVTEVVPAASGGVNAVTTAGGANAITAAGDTDQVVVAVGIGLCLILAVGLWRRSDAATSDPLALLRRSLSRSPPPPPVPQVQREELVKQLSEEQEALGRAQARHQVALRAYEQALTTHRDTEHARSVEVGVSRIQVVLWCGSVESGYNCGVVWGPGAAASCCGTRQAGRECSLQSGCQAFSQPAMIPGNDFTPDLHSLCCG